MMNPVSANAYEARMIVNGRECRTLEGQDGACTSQKSPHQDITVSIGLMAESQIRWKSNCEFTYKDQRVTEGAQISTFPWGVVNLNDIPEEDFCTIAISVLETETDTEAQGFIGLINVLVKSPDYVVLSYPYVSFKGDMVKIKASQYAKYIKLENRFKRELLIKTTDFEVEKSYLPITLYQQSAIGRRNSYTIK